MSSCLLVDDFGVDGVGHMRVRLGGRACWSRVGWSWWLSSVLVAWASLVFEVVGVITGRGVGGRVACPRPLPWHYPSGFAGVSFATVLGLGVWWPVRGLLVVALWPWWVSMVWAMCVFEGVGVPAGRGSGRVAGRGWGRWCGTSVCSSMFEGVGGCVGCRLGRLGGRWLTTFECSRVWVGVLAVVGVV